VINPRCDSRGRSINYLRVSVTDRCNLRCVYCMPEDGIPSISHENVLRYEEITRLVGVAVALGISEVRLTGGEPLVRKGIEHLVRSIASIPGLGGLSMTTNGVLLAPLAEKVAEAGLQRVNISLDTLRPARFRSITRRGGLSTVLAGIEAAHRAGLKPVKINVVIMRGVNDDEVVDFARLTATAGWNVRFIELMPLGASAGFARSDYVPGDEIRATIEAELGPLEPAALLGNGPASVWRLPGSDGTLGFISAISHRFCSRCNRLRLTSDGKLLPCLFSDLEVDLRRPLREGASDAVLTELFRRAIDMKPSGYRLGECVAAAHEMSRIGG
jgi:cyclic pyranopterin phosphate synthase